MIAEVTMTPEAPRCLEHGPDQYLTILEVLDMVEDIVHYYGDCR
jgi:uncharacterized protein YerC